MKTDNLLKRRTPLLVTTGSEAGGEGTGTANGGGGGVAPWLLSFAKAVAVVQRSESGLFEHER